MEEIENKIKCSCGKTATTEVCTMSFHTIFYCDDCMPELGSLTQAAIDEGRIPGPINLKENGIASEDYEKRD